MKQSEFYRRAASDPAFRRQALDDLRYFKQVGLGLTCFCGAIAFGIFLYSGWTHREWNRGGEMLFVAALTGSTWLLFRRRMSALEALDRASRNREKTD